MVNIFYRYKMPSACEPKLHCQTVHLKDAPPILEALMPVSSEILIDHVHTLDQLRNVRQGPTDKAQRIK